MDFRRRALLAALAGIAAPAVAADPVFHDPMGRRRTLAHYKGKVVMLYFGFTFCPDVCPTDLQQIARALRLLGPKARDVQPLFVTLDPMRDTPRLLGQYARAFHPRLVALRGTESETRRLARMYDIEYRRVSRPGTEDYSIDHAAYTLLLDRKGRLADTIRPGTPAGRMAVMVEEVLERG
jgi:protein SCO1/2